MPVQQTYKVSDIEKRLKLLNMQLHGKQEQVASNKYYVSRDQTDLTYLKQDLSKIALLASMAIGTELILLKLF